MRRAQGISRPLTLSVLPPKFVACAANAGDQQATGTQCPSPSAFAAYAASAGDQQATDTQCPALGVRRLCGERRGSAGHWNSIGAVGCPRLPQRIKSPLNLPTTSSNRTHQEETHDPSPASAPGFHHLARRTRPARRPRHYRNGQRPVRVRLEAVQGPADRSQFPVVPTRRPRQAHHPEVRGTDRHQGRLRANPGAAAAPESGDGDGHRPPQLRRGKCRHARAEAPGRASKLDGGPAPLHRRQMPDQPRFRPRPTSARRR